MGKNKDLELFTRVPKVIAMSKKYSPTEKAVLMAILAHYPTMCPGLELIASYVGVSTKTVSRAIANLERNKAITVQRTKGGSNIYSLHSIFDASRSEVAAKELHKKRKVRKIKVVKKDTTAPIIVRTPMSGGYGHPCPPSTDTHVPLRRKEEEKIKKKNFKPLVSPLGRDQRHLGNYGLASLSGILAGVGILIPKNIIDTLSSSSDEWIDEGFKYPPEHRSSL